MVTKVTVKGKPELQIVVPGAEAEYVAIMQALTIGIANIREENETNAEAKRTLSRLLIAMLPGEENIVMTSCIKDR